MNATRKHIGTSILFLLLSIGIHASVVDTVSIKNHLNNIVNTDLPRNHQNVATLNYVADYIYSDFVKYADTVYYQPYTVYGNEYKNVICVFGSQFTETIVVGAHYDVCGDQDGADDNATGVVGLLELAKMLVGTEVNYRIELVAYTLEEPPYFRSVNMGSHVHAKSLHDNNVNVYGMFCLEMLGYYDDAKKSQDYPLGILSLIYGNKGNYITLVNKFSKGKFARKFGKKFRRQRLIKTKKFTGPESLPGIDFSDHLNYWEFGYSAFMITDTAFYRNKNYHQTSDKISTLDLWRMSKVIETTFHALVKMK